MAHKNKKLRKIFVIGAQTHYINWMEGVLTDKMEEADLVVLTGGEDVGPSLYHKKPHWTTEWNPWRDARETEAFDKARALNKPIIGICRGAQFLCVKAGGILVQHQQNPKYFHFTRMFDNVDIVCTSTHHQAQYPWLMPKSDYKVLGWTKGISDFHLGENDLDELVINKVEGEKEVEMAYYPKIKGLGIQMHPEMIFPRKGEHIEFRKTIRYCRNLLDTFLAGNL